MSDKDRVIIFDTTMRDGEQSPGASMSLEEKIQIARVFDELGIDMLAMIHYEHGFLEKLTREPVIEKVSFNINIPFLILPYTD